MKGSMWKRLPGGFYTKEDEELQMEAYIAQRYYERRKNLGQIAEEIGIGRKRAQFVRRCLDRARERGIVQIKLNMPEVVKLSHALEDALDAWHLQHWRPCVGLSNLTCVRVVAVGDEGPDVIRSSVAARAVDYLVGRDIFRSFRKIGIVGGETLRDVISLLPTDLSGNDGMEIYPLSVGGVPDLADVSTNSLVGHLTAKLKERGFQATGYNLNVPPLMDEKEKDDFLKRPGVREVFQGAHEVECAIMSVGTLQDPASTLWRYLRGYGVEDDSVAELSEHSPGDLNYTLLDPNGDALDDALNKQVVGVPVEKIRDMASDGQKISILVTSGVSKSDITVAVLKGNFFNVLIIDEQCALEVLKKLKKEIKDKA